MHSLARGVTPAHYRTNQCKNLRDFIIILVSEIKDPFLVNTLRTQIFSDEILDLLLLPGAKMYFYFLKRSSQLKELTFF